GARSRAAGGPARDPTHHRRGSGPGVGPGPAVPAAGADGRAGPGHPAALDPAVRGPGPGADRSGGTVLTRSRTARGGGTGSVPPPRTSGWIRTPRGAPAVRPSPRPTRP